MRGNSLSGFCRQNARAAPLFRGTMSIPAAQSASHVCDRAALPASSQTSFSPWLWAFALVYVSGRPASREHSGETTSRLAARRAVAYAKLGRCNGGSWARHLALEGGSSDAEKSLDVRQFRAGLGSPTFPCHDGPQASAVGSYMGESMLHSFLGYFASPAYKCRMPWMDRRLNRQRPFCLGSEAWVRSGRGCELQATMPWRRADHENARPSSPFSVHIYVCRGASENSQEWSDRVPDGHNGR